jgi:hypothetical protein
VGLLMDIKTFKELSDLFQEVDSSWFLYQEQIKKIYGEDDYKVLIDEFEEFIKNDIQNAKQFCSKYTICMLF